MSNLAQKPKYLLNMSLIGDAVVGKTSLLSNYMGTFYSGGDTYGCYTGTPIIKDNIGGFTLGFPYSTEIDGKEITLFCRDIFDLQKFQYSPPSRKKRYFKVIHGIFIIFDLTNRSSFTNLENWFESLLTYIGDKPVPIAIIGNKSDLLEKTQEIIKEKEIAGLRISIQDRFKLNMEYVQNYRTSCKTGVRVENLFNNFLTKVIAFLESHN